MGVGAPAGAGVATGVALAGALPDSLLDVEAGAFPSVEDALQFWTALFCNLTLEISPPAFKLLVVLVIHWVKVAEGHSKGFACHKDALLTHMGK